MTNPYTRVNSWSHRLRQLGLTAALLSGATVAAHAQFSYQAFATTNITSTYTDLGTTGTVIATANTDDANSAAQDIGFNFAYNGTVFTQFVLNTNGLMRLGAAAPSSAAACPTYAQTPELSPINSTNAADVNLLLPFNFDLTAGSAGAEYRVVTTGTAGSRICTIQWKNVADKVIAASAGTGTIPNQYDNLSFQVKLYEGSNQIDFVYSTATAGTNGLKYAVVGLKGSSNAANQDIIAVKGSTAAWSTTTFTTGPQLDATVANAHNFRSVAAPDAGRTYRFRTVAANDAGVTAIYTYGKLATASTLPHAVRAVITNSGSTAKTNVVATLNVTGANTFTDTKTVATLAAGASSTVTFANYPATLAAGTNLVTVTVPADDNAANNTATYGQVVTTNRVSYTDPSGTVAGSVGVGTPGGALASKFVLSAATTLSDVTLDFSESTFATTTYQVVLYDATGTGGVPGNILYTSPTQTRTGAASTPVISIPGVQVPASFYIGVKELDNNPGLNYQAEDPLRPTTFYYSSDGATVWTAINNTTLRTRLAIEFGVVPPACAGPTAVTVSNITTTGATINFTAATTTPTSYQIVYGPAGFNPATGGTSVTATTSPVVLTGLISSSAYQVYVRSNCVGGGNSLYTPVVSFSTGCDATAAITVFPYNLNFDSVPTGSTLPCGVTTLDANADGATWRISTENPNSGTNSIRYNGIVVNNVAANDWFFTPALTLAPATATTRYQVAFRYRTSGVGATATGVESLEVTSGTAATVAAQTNVLYTNAAITNTTYALANGTSTPAVALLPTGAATRYVGFHIKSAANQGNLYIDDVSVTAVTITATTSEALLRAVNVFPNPSTGVFELAIQGANAKGNLGVLVTNTLGQQVYTGSARDNYTTKLDLSNLAAGLYHLQVRNGDETMTRQIAIVK